MNPQEFIDAVAQKERSERSTRGLPPDHVLDLSQFPFAFTKNEVRTFKSEIHGLHQGSPSAASALYCAMCACADMNYDAANQFMDTCQTLEPNDGKARMRFGTTPPPNDIPLPRVEGQFPTESALFLACDKAYFVKYTIPLLRSLVVHSQTTRVHIHYFGPEHDAVKAVLQQVPLSSSLTHENPHTFIKHHRLAPPLYYGAVRVVRFAEALNTAPSLIACDTDALIAGPIAPFTQLALRIRGGRLEPWNQFSACLISATAADRLYFSHVSEIIKSDIQFLWWGLDQYALLSAWIRSKPPLTLIGPDTASVDANISGKFWFTAGKRKLALSTAETAYARLYRSYNS